ncbi:MAG: patatin-like phospholipase family protein [Acetatifactor sp.]|nr:patatin-like phospholipase family protein [Acetatifactor sp.]
MNSKQILKQFKEEAPDSPYITQKYLKHFCKEHRKYIPVPPIHMGKIGKKIFKGKTLLESEGWRIQYLKRINRICILNSKRKCRAVGKRKQILAPILYDIHAQEKIEGMKAQGRLDYGIVFCGGGAKGAFQLGVWKWLSEHDFAERFNGISGASVGALNALLFAQGDYEKAEAAWMKMEKGDLTRPNEALANQVLVNNVRRCFGMENAVVLSAQLLSILTDWRETAGLFSREKLERIVRENISLEALEDKLVYVSLTALALLSMQIFAKSEYTYLDTRSKDSEEKNIKKVLASAAYPGAYTPVGVDGKICIDGGALDNEPVYPLIKAGYRNILVVHLKRREKDGKDRQESFHKRLRKKFSEEELAGVRICHVWPQQSLKDLLEIDPKLTQRRINAGYEAAASQLEDSFFGN